MSIRGGVPTMYVLIACLDPFVAWVWPWFTLSLSCTVHYRESFLWIGFVHLHRYALLPARFTFAAHVSQVLDLILARLGVGRSRLFSLFVA